MGIMMALALQLVTADVAETLSPQARAALAKDAARSPVGPDLASRRLRAEQIQEEIGARQLARYRVRLRDTTIAGVPVRMFEPNTAAHGGRMLLNLHGGGFIVDAGSLTENVPLAALTGSKVVALRYRLAPEHPFPAALDDAEAVYTALLREQPRVRIAVYGTSSGAILAAELVARLKAAAKPLPTALGFFSGTGDLQVFGDSARLFLPEGAAAGATGPYLGGRSASDPAVSPARGDLAGWPPTLCVSSTRDFLLSATASFCRRLDEAGTDARLIVHDGLPHAFWSYVEAPESDAAFAGMATFLRRHLEVTQ